MPHKILTAFMVLNLKFLSTKLFKPDQTDFSFDKQYFLCISTIPVTTEIAWFSFFYSRSITISVSVVQIFMYLYQNLRPHKSLRLSFRSEKNYSNSPLESTLTCVIPIAKVPHNGPKVYKMKLAENFQRWSHIQLTLTNSGLKYTSQQYTPKIIFWKKRLLSNLTCFRFS